MMTVPTQLSIDEIKELPSNTLFVGKNLQHSRYHDSCGWLTLVLSTVSVRIDEQMQTFGLVDAFLC